MNSAVQFLQSMAQTFAAMNLYAEGHPARERALDQAFRHLQDFQAATPTAEFTFLGGEVLLGREPLWELRDWDWAARLAGVGVQRIAFVGPVSRPDLEAFLDDVGSRMSETATTSSAEARPTRETAIRYGLVRLKGDEEGEGEEEVTTATLGFTLREEAEAVEWLHDRLEKENELHLLEAEAIVRSLTVAMHGDQQFLMPLLRLKEFDQYTTTHALNVSVLAMALAEFIGLGPREVRTFGISGLLHDVGKTRIPREILNKPGKLSEAEREVMNSHTVEGAKLIMETDHQLDLAAVVAYEHHIRIDGGGYPRLAYPRPCHQCSNLVHVCDVYDALRTERPYREAWEHARVIDLISEGLGVEFDERLGRAFIEMMNQWDTRIATLTDPAQEVTVDRPDEEGVRAETNSGSTPPASGGPSGTGP